MSFMAVPKNVEQEPIYIPEQWGFFSHKLYYGGVREKWDNVFVKLRVKYHPFCGIARKIPYTYGVF